MFSWIWWRRCWFRKKNMNESQHQRLLNQQLNHRLTKSYQDVAD